MNDMIKSGSSLEEIAQSINQIKAEVRDVAIRGAIEIGKYLHTAKSMVPYGEWGQWLSENVDYSERTAQDLMRIANEYGRKETQALAEIQNTTQAVMLLALDSAERDQFVQEHDMTSLSTRELETELARIKEEKARQQLTIEELIGKVNDLTGRLDEETAPAPTEELEAERRRADDLTHSLEEARRQVLETEQRREADVIREREAAQKAEKQLAKAKAEAQEAKQKAEAQQKQLTRMEEELTEARENVRTVEIVPEAVTAELDRLRARAAQTGMESELRAAFEMFKNAFSHLMDKLSEAESPEQGTGALAAQYRAAFHKATLTMAERMK